MNNLPRSTSLLRDANSILRGTSVSVLGVSAKPTESFPDYVRRVRNEKGFSQPDVERNSGNTITDGYVSQIENGYIKNVSPQKLIALAKGLGVSADEVFAAARGMEISAPDSPQELLHLFHGWNEATAEDRKFTMEAIKMIAESFQRRRMQKKEPALNSSPDAPKGKDGKRQPRHPAEVERPDNWQDIPVTDTPERVNGDNGDELEKKEESPRRPRTKRR